MKKSYTLPVAVLAVLAVWPLVIGDEFYLHIGTLILMTGIGATGLHLVMRTGQLFMAQAGFIGIGSYTSVLLMMKLNLPFPFAVAGAMAVPALIALLLGPIIFRLRGTYFVLISFALGEVIQLTFSNWQSVTGGSNGIYGIPSPGALFTTRLSYYYLTLVCAVLAIGFVIRLVRSEFGRNLDAVRDGELFARSTGVPVARFKLIAFVISAALAGLQGSLNAHFIKYISPISFTFDQSLTYVVINVIGGMKNVAGPLIGTLFLVPLPEFLRGLHDYERIFYGLILILCMGFASDGLVGLVRKLGRSKSAEKGGQAAA